MSAATAAYDTLLRAVSNGAKVLHWTQGAG